MLILFEDGVCEDVEAGDAGDSHYMLLTTPLASSTTARRGDIVELAAEGKIWRFLRIVQPSTDVTIQLVVPKEDGDWGALRNLFDALEQVGGKWERAYGGLVLLHVPAEHGEAIRAQVDALTAG